LGLVDFNKDGKQDILWRNLANNAFHAWQMDGFSAVKDLDIEDEPDTAWHPVALGDFNKDGNVDIVFRYYWKDNTGHDRVWLMDGNNRVSGVDLPRVEDGNWHINGAGDFNQDGNVDLLWRNYASGENHVWFMDGTNKIGGAVLPTEADPNWQISGNADFNKDGKIDILWRNYATGANTVWLSRIELES
jgi:FG-GAP-like repeat